MKANIRIEIVTDTHKVLAPCKALDLETPDDVLAQTLKDMIEQAREIMKTAQWQR